MAIGNQPGNGGLNNSLAGYAGQLNDVLTKINHLSNYATALGSGGLIGTGMTSGDATAYLTAIGSLNTMYLVWNGLATVSTPTNFLANLTGPTNAGLF